MSSRFNLKFHLDFTSSWIKRIEIDIKFDYKQWCCIKYGPFKQFKQRAAHRVSISGFGTELFFFWSLKAIIGQNFHWGSLLTLCLQICQSKSWCLFKKPKEKQPLWSNKSLPWERMKKRGNRDKKGDRWGIRLWSTLGLKWEEAAGTTHGT